jgi:DNA polymerase III gamma/tau subunit
MKELYKKYRPKKLADVVGHTSVIGSLQKKLEKGNMPHAILFSGGPGVGKTTLARILRRELNCGDQDFKAINAADFNGIDTIRKISRVANMCPISGDCRVWVVDECHKLTNEAQNAFLNILEDTPSHVYFFLCTTDSGKIIEAVRSRCTEIKLGSISDEALTDLINRVIKAEELKLTPEVVDEIVSAAEGSARKALVILDQVGQLDSSKEQMAAVSKSAITKGQAIELARALFNPKAEWFQIANLLRDLKDEPEQIRYLILGYAKSCLLGRAGERTMPYHANRAFEIIDIFARNFYDSKHAGLAAACFEAWTRRPKS